MVKISGMRQPVLGQSGGLYIIQELSKKIPLLKGHLLLDMFFVTFAIGPSVEKVTRRDTSVSKREESQSVNNKEQCSVPDVSNGLGAKAGELFIDVYQTTDH